MAKNKYIYVAIFLGFICLIISCKKLGITPDPQCDFPVEVWYLNPKIEQSGFQYMAPHFNPNNSQEFVFFKYDFGQKKGGLYKYNLITKEESHIVDAGVIPMARWSVKDWIAFTNSDRQIWKIKSNGDSLTQLTNFGENFYPDWNSEGTQLIIKRTDQSPIDNWIILTENGQKIMELDSTLGTSNWHSWSPDGRILSYLFGPSLVYTYIDSIKPIIIPNITPSGGGIIRHSWENNSESIIWSGNNGIFRTNIFSHETEQITHACDEIIYMYISISPDGKTLLLDRNDREYITSDALTYETKEQRSIYIMDIDGQNERKLEFN
ncbi:MAG: hypothetical protein R3B93_11220 [Bacteroidia bacterium]